MGSGSQAALEATHRRAFGARRRVVSVKQEHFIAPMWNQGLYTTARRTLRRQTQPSNRWRVSLHLLLVTFLPFVGGNVAHTSEPRLTT